MVVYVNGEIVERAEATVSAFDRSFLYGDGLFETIRAYHGVPFMLAEHLERMAGSTAELGIRMPDREGISEAVAQLIERNGLSDAYVRITLSRGVHTGELVPDEPPEPTLVIEARPLHPYPSEMYEKGGAVIVSSVKHDSSSPARRHKTTSYLPSLLAKREAKERGADEAILLDHEDRVAEGATSNVFCAWEGQLFTPPLELNILPGVVRATVLRLAREAGLEVHESIFSLTALRLSDEVFLTNSLMEVMPVRAVDREAATTVPGPITSSLAAAYKRLTPQV